MTDQQYFEKSGWGSRNDHNLDQTLSIFGIGTANAIIVVVALFSLGKGFFFW